MRFIDPDNIKPKLAAEPLRTRGDNEPWLAWATELYAHTLAELAMTHEAWAAHFGAAHPGDGYTRTLEAQKRRLGNDIKAVGEGHLRGFLEARGEGQKTVMHGLFVTAIEGGINYWAGIESYRWAKSAAGVEMTDDIDGFHAVIVDTAGEKPKKYHVTAGTFARGLKSMEQKFPAEEHLGKLARALNGPNAGDIDYDAGDADAVLQMGLFNDIVYS